MGNCWADGVTAQITNFVLRTALCGEARVARALDGLHAAVLLLCHISRDGFIILHIISGEMERIWLFFRAVLHL